MVIPTRGREARLAFALESLAGQLDPGRFEVIVVRDADAARPFAVPPQGLRVRFLTRCRASPARPRSATSAGARPRRRWSRSPTTTAAPHPGWLEALLAPPTAPDAFLQGRTAPDPDERHLLHGLARSVDVPAPTGWFETCNMAYPRALLERLGGFDEAFGFGGEDTDLAWRAIECRRPSRGSSRGRWCGTR